MQMVGLVLSCREDVPLSVPLSGLSSYKLFIEVYVGERYLSLFCICFNQFTVFPQHDRYNAVSIGGYVITTSPLLVTVYIARERK